MVIQGRFFPLRDGKDLNTTNFGQLEKDPMTGIFENKKYPCCVMMPPTEKEKVDDQGWSAYQITMYFLTLNGQTGDGGIKQPDMQTLTSTQPFQQDWSDMRQCAGQFRKMIRQITNGNDTNGNRIMSYLQEHPRQVDIYHRVTNVGADNANGVCLIFEMRVFNGYNLTCNQPLPDYPNGVPTPTINYIPTTLSQQ